MYQEAGWRKLKCVAAINMWYASFFCNADIYFWFLNQRSDEGKNALEIWILFLEFREPDAVSCFSMDS